jgi:hypothetical protein
MTGSSEEKLEKDPRDMGFAIHGEHQEPGSRGSRHAILGHGEPRPPYQDEQTNIKGR